MAEPAFPSLLCSMHGRTCVQCPLVGTIRNARPGRWVVDGGQTTNLLSTDQYKEIILVEDEELVASGSQMGTSRGSKSIYSSTKMTVWTEAPYR